MHGIVKTSHDVAAHLPKLDQYANEGASQDDKTRVIVQQVKEDDDL
jgi:hypothetical protein